MMKTRTFMMVLCSVGLLTACGPQDPNDASSDESHHSNTDVDGGVSGSDTQQPSEPGGSSETQTPGEQEPGVDAGTPVERSPVGPEVLASCTDGKYAEVLPSTTADIQSLMSAYTPASYKTFINDVLGARYTVGQHIVSQALTISPQDCVDLFIGKNKDTAQGVMSILSTLVHECGHLLDIYGRSGGAQAKYVIRPDLEFSCPASLFRGSGGFARSRILNDEYTQKLPPCTSSPGPNCDSYANVYLSGDPDDSTFDSGDQGFDMLLEEATQYVNSLATQYAYADQIPSGSRVSAKDGLLTLLWYVERYLAMARTQYPETYEYLVKNACWRDAVLTVWGRAWLYLETTASISKLGIKDSTLLTLVREPALLEEIERLRVESGCQR